MGVNNGHRKKLFSIGTVDIASISVGLLLEIVLHFEKHGLTRSQGNVLDDRGEKRGMQDQNLELFKNTSGFLPLSKPVKDVKCHHKAYKGPEVRNRLATATNGGKESLPPDLVETLPIGVPAEPDKHRFADHMVKGHKAPVPGVF